MKKGFTLIELLVVVLIIGILSSVALPQYNRAVLKARTMEGVVQGRAFVDALHRHEMATGENFTNDLEALDIELSPNWMCATAYCKFLVNGNDKSGIQLEVSISRTRNASLICAARTSNKDADSVCKSIAGKEKNHSSENFNYYFIYNITA